MELCGWSPGREASALDLLRPGGGGDCDSTKLCPLTWELGGVPTVACRGQAGYVGACH